MEKGKIRIIGGRWRGKKILFPINPNLRPTPDRAKETVFNWLGNDLTGISCLDLFAVQVQWELKPYLEVQLELIL